MHFTSTSTCMNFLSQFHFLTPWTIIVHGWKGNFGCFEGNINIAISLKPEVTPTKIGLPAFHVDFYLHEFFEQILFFDPMDYSLWSEREIWPFLKAKEK